MQPRDRTSARANKEAKSIPAGNQRLAPLLDMHYPAHNFSSRDFSCSPWDTRAHAASVVAKGQRSVHGKYCRDILASFSLPIRCISLRICLRFFSPPSSSLLRSAMSYFISRFYWISHRRFFFHAKRFMYSQKIAPAKAFFEEMRQKVNILLKNLMYSNIFYWIVAFHLSIGDFFYFLNLLIYCECKRK